MPDSQCGLFQSIILTKDMPTKVRTIIYIVRYRSNVLEMMFDRIWGCEGWGCSVRDFEMNVEIRIWITF